MSGVCLLRSEINYGNIRLRMTLKQMSGACLYVRKLITVTFGSYDAKTNVGCLPLRSEINYGNIRLRMTLKQMSGVCLYVRK